MSSSEDGWITPDAVWRGNGDAGEYRVRIVDIRRDGRVMLERISVPGRPRLDPRPELTVTADQLKQAFCPTGEFDFGYPLY